MSLPQLSSGSGRHVTLFNDGEKTESTIVITPALADVLAYAHAWAVKDNRRDNVTLSFSSTLAALVAGPDPLCHWLSQHLELRGTTPSTATKGYSFATPVLPVETLTTSFSFRQALVWAERLARGRALDVRHLMAAYAVVEAYHPRDFLRLHIDRRAWCLALSTHLQRTQPAEAREWAEYAKFAPPVPLPNFNPDVPAGDDLLGVGREVEAFATLIAARRTAMPLSIGVFGAWGAGKSYFMRAVESRVASLAATGEPGSPFLRSVAQVRFNAWHYSEGNIVAALVDQIFRNLRFGPAESGAVLEQRRAEVLAQVTDSDEQLRAQRRVAEEASTRTVALAAEVRRLAEEHASAATEKRAELAGAQAALAGAQQRLEDALLAQTRAMADARTAAPGAEIASRVADTILGDPQIAALRGSLERGWADVRWAGMNVRVIVWGIAAAAATGAALALVPVLRDSTAVRTVATTVALLAPAGARVIGLLRRLAKDGQELQAAIARRADAAAAEVRDHTALLVSERKQAVEEAGQIATTLRQGLDALSTLMREAETALSAAEERQRAATIQLETASREASGARSRLEALGLYQLLGSTIDEAASTEEFRRQLGTVSLARSYLQRLSESMTDACKRAEVGGVPPILERVVLYIDDLDRCPQNKVRDVLQTVHLLLAFDLFTCVVAVDPRWVLQSLDGSPGLGATGGRARHQPGEEDSDLAVLGGAASASDYLEKIFQIPLWLRPVEAGKRAAIAAALLRGTDQTGWAVHTDPPSAPERATGATPSGPSDLGPPPRQLIAMPLADREIAFLQQRLTPLLDGNTRALKRFVNTYHLVKAALSEVELKAYEVDPMNFQVCMAQLALLATQRTRARKLVRLVDETAPAAGARLTVKEWLDVAAGAPAATDVASDLAAVLLPDLAAMEWETFRVWFERTRRYSFYL